MLPGMGRQKSIGDVLAENYDRLRNKSKEAGVWREPKVSPKTANNVRKSRHNTKLETVVELAKACGVEPYQLLMPAEDENFLVIFLAWAQSDASARDNLVVIADAMLRKSRQNATRSEPIPTPAPPHRKRNRSG